MMNSRPTRKPEGRGPFLKLRRMIAGVAASKPFLITVSALAAIVCWSALVASDGTLTRQKSLPTSPSALRATRRLRAEATS